MRYEPERHHRRSIRLKGYDYRQAGAYFITLVTQNRACLFGEVVDGEMRLNAYGEIVRDCWLSIPEHFPRVLLDAFVVMPNHVHGIIVLSDTRAAGTRRGALQQPPETEQFSKPVAGSIPTIVRSFKSAVTKRINEHRGAPGTPVWQRNYHEHIIRNEDDFEAIRHYILTNPLHWHQDHENPHSTADSSV
jgi:putative transposase